MKWSFPALGIICILILSPSLRAESETISVKAELDNAFITIGDEVIYTVTIRHAPDVQILSRISPPAQDIIKIKKIEEFDGDQDGYVVAGRKMFLTSYRLGEFVIDPVEIEYREKGGEIKTISTNKLYLTVESIAKGETKQDIRDVKGVYDLETNFKPLIYAGIALFILLVLFLWIIPMWRKKKQLAEASKPRKSPEEEALFALNQLFDSDLLKQGMIKEYFFGLSEIMKIFFERRLRVNALEATTFEIVREMKSRRMDENYVSLVENVMESADLAKFAKWKPEPVEIVNLNKKSKRLIMEAIPEGPKNQDGV